MLPCEDAPAVATACTLLVPKHLIGHLMKRPIDYSKLSREELIKRLKKYETIPSVASKSYRPFDFSNYPTKHVALKIAYFGWNYNGFASQISYKPLKDMENEKEEEGLVDRSVGVTTVEDVLFAALLKTRLVDNPRKCNYSRCGRTDSGVSSTGQVVALTVRSSAKKGSSESFDIPICQMLNRTLPKEIRVLGWSRVPDEFNARFDCAGREYKYFFSGLGLDILAMRKAAEMLVGIHDFRNFCRKDPSREIINYMRQIYNTEIVEEGEGMYHFRIHGSAFLYHQVRCTMEILFLVGRGLEPPEVVSYMLDLERCTERPKYELASEIPLVLIKCHYPSKFSLQWNFEEVEKGRLGGEIFALQRDMTVKAMTANLLGDLITKESPFKGKVNAKPIYPRYVA